MKDHTNSLKELSESKIYSPPKVILRQKQTKQNIAWHQLLDQFLLNKQMERKIKSTFLLGIFGS